MKISVLPGLATLALLASCHKLDGDAIYAEQKIQGRYSGVGIYEAGELWRKILGAANPQDPETAKIADDEHVIVVVDTRTGEIRQCGDHSGYCIAITPWAANRQVGIAPSKLAAHGADKPDGKIADDAATEGK